MSIAENIRQLSKAGLSTAEIARQLGIRYQHAYNVLRSANNSADMRPLKIAVRPEEKPELTTENLHRCGFRLSGRWILNSTGQLILDQPASHHVGVYAFAIDGIVLYVGVATMGLSRRLYFYGRPGPTQRTSLRLNDIIRKAVLSASIVEIYTAEPPDLEWNGLPVHGSAGLELGLIKKYKLPWNKRSAG